MKLSFELLCNHFNNSNKTKRENGQNYFRRQKITAVLWIALVDLIVTLLY